MRSGSIGWSKVCKGNTTESGKTCGGRVRRIISRGDGLLASANISKSLFAIPPPMAGLVAIPTIEGDAVSVWLSVWISAGGASRVGKECGEGLSKTVRDQSLDGSSVFGGESRRTGMSGGVLLGLLAKVPLL